MQDCRLIFLIDSFNKYTTQQTLVLISTILVHYTYKNNIIWAWRFIDTSCAPKQEINNERLRESNLTNYNALKDEIRKIKTETSPVLPEQRLENLGKVLKLIEFDFRLDSRTTNHVYLVSDLKIKQEFTNMRLSPQIHGVNLKSKI